MPTGRSLAAAGFCILARILELQAATYYVDPEKGLNTNPGTIEQPWQTIQRSVKTGWPVEYRQPGDIVYLRGGLYRGNTNGIDINGVAGAVPGRSDAPITIMAYPGETPVVCDQVSPYRGVIIKNLGWWAFDGITFSNCYQSVWMENCTNFLWRNCTFGWMPDIGSAYAGLQFWGSSQFNTVSNCTFARWGRVTEGCNDHGVSISIGDESNDTPMYYNLIVSNQFLYGGHDHFQINTAFNVIRGNLFVNAPWMPTNATCNTLPSIGGVPIESNMYGAYGNRHTKPGDAGTSQVDMRNLWEGNTFLYTGPPPDDYGAFGIELGTRQSIYRFNILAYSLAAGIYFNTSGTTTLSTSNAVYGNVICGNGLSHLYGGQGMRSFSAGIGTSTFEGRRTNNFVVNNIVWRNYPVNLSSATLTWQQCRGNLTDNAVDPLFVSTNGWGYVFDPNSLPDFHLQAGSPCIDAGTWLAYTTGAGSGTTMSVDNSLYFSDGNRIASGDTIQLQGQAVTSTVVSNDWQNNTLYLSSPLTWTKGQGVSLRYSGNAPDQGAFEWQGSTAPAPVQNLRKESNR